MLYISFFPNFLVVYFCQLFAGLLLLLLLLFCYSSVMDSEAAPKATGYCLPRFTRLCFRKSVNLIYHNRSEILLYIQLALVMVMAASLGPANRPLGESTLEK